MPAGKPKSLLGLSVLKAVTDFQKRLLTGMTLSSPVSTSNSETYKLMRLFYLHIFDTDNYTNRPSIFLSEFGSSNLGTLAQVLFLFFFYQSEKEMVTEKPDSDTRRLYGGAMTTTIPAAYADISMIREVPDNQEVFAHADTDRSVIVELLELQQDIPTDQTPAQFHLANIAEESGALHAHTHRLLTLPATDFPSLRAGDPNLSVTAAYGTHVVSKFKDAAELASHVDVYVACVRLPRVTTDLLLVFNDPRVLHPQGSSALSGSAVAQDGDEDADKNNNGTSSSNNNNNNSGRDGVLRNALRSLRIHEWSLLEG